MLKNYFRYPTQTKSELTHRTIDISRTKESRDEQNAIQSNDDRFIRLSEIVYVDWVLIKIIQGFSWKVR